MPFKQNKTLKNVNKGFDRFQADTKIRTERALYAAAVTGAGISKVMTPIDTSNLVNSQFIRLIPKSTGWSATIGYTANYAAAVHEKPGKLRGQSRPDGSAYWGPSGEPQFLSKAFEGNNLKQVTQVFYRGMKI